MWGKKSLTIIFVSAILISLEIGNQVDNILFIRFFCLWMPQMLMTPSPEIKILGQKRRV